MEEQNEILAAMREGFARVDQQFARVDQQFARVDQQFARVDQQFARVDEQFQTLRREFAEQLDGVSEGLRLELRAQNKRLVQGVEAVRAVIEGVDTKLGLMGENVANVMHEIARYHATVETPLDNRVTKLEGRVWTLEQKK